MKNRSHYIHVYKQLELPESATYELLRENYRRLAALHHPDKTISAVDKQQNNRLFQDIQTAYQELKQFHSKNGRLPLEAKLKYSNQDHGNTNLPNTHTTSRLNLSPTIYTPLILIAVILLLLPAIDETNPIEQKTPLNESTLDTSQQNDPLNKPLGGSIKALNTRPIELGMKMGKVFDILGVPDTNVGNYWYYGDSVIYFRDGRIVGWLIDPNSPILIPESKPAVITPPVRFK